MKNLIPESNFSRIDNHQKTSLYIKDISCIDKALLFKKKVRIEN